MKELLQVLSASKIVRVTGSYADGSNTELSDIDFRVKEDTPDTPAPDRNIRKIMAILDKFQIKYDSSFVGEIHTHNVDYSLPLSLDFSDVFIHRPNRVKKVSIMDVEFLTW